jgi:DNA-binding CsgD family transcriptional regulator
VTVKQTCENPARGEDASFATILEILPEQRRDSAESLRLPTTGRPPIPGDHLAGGRLRRGRPAYFAGALEPCPLPVHDRLTTRAPGPRSETAEAVLMTNQGFDRAGAVELAERALEDPALEIDRTWQAVLVLVYADEVDLVEKSCPFVRAAPSWMACEYCRVRMELLGARIWMASGGYAKAAAALRGLLGTAPNSRLRHLTISWLLLSLTQLGRLDEANDLLQRSELDSRPLDGLPDHVELTFARGYLHYRCNRLQQALDDFIDCGRWLMERRVFNPVVKAWRSWACLTALALGQRELADVLATDDLLAALRWGTNRAVGTALWCRALVSDNPQAYGLCDSMALLSRSPALDVLADVQFEAGMLAARRGNVTAAQHLLSESGDVAERLGNAFRAERASSAARQPQIGLLSTLTKRELECARLARAGLTNSEIAARIFVSAATVEYHLTRAYRKLGVLNRDELSFSTAALL